MNNEFKKRWVEQRRIQMAANLSLPVLLITLALIIALPLADADL
jgi:hypothetical protein